MIQGSHLTPAAGDSGSAAEGMQRARSGAIMQASLPRPAAAPEPYRWAVPCKIEFYHLDKIECVF